VVQFPSGKIDLYCTLCKQNAPVKSNLGVAEECQRMIEYLLSKPEPEIICPTPGCEQHELKIPVSKGLPYYRKYGKSKAGTPLVQCRECKRVIALVHQNNDPLYHQHRSCINKRLFKQMFNGACIGNNFGPETPISKASFYDKLEFFHRQAMAFAASKEKVFLEATEAEPLMVKDKNGVPQPIKRFYVSLDRQYFTINWRREQPRRKKGAPKTTKGKMDRRVVILSAVTSCDEERKYIFGQHLNYDGSENYRDMRDYMDDKGEDEFPQCFRKYARFWTEAEHESAGERSDKLIEIKKKREEASPLGLSIEDESDLRSIATSMREDVESADDMQESDTQLPLRGLMAKDDYTIYGHFFFLRRLLGWVEKTRFFFEQESAMRAACLTMFADKIKENRCDAFFVWFQKNLDEENRDYVTAENKEMIKEYAKKHGMAFVEARIQMMKEAILAGKTRPHSTFSDLFVKHPFPPSGEPEKELAHLTFRGFSPEGIKNEDHLANLYGEATMQKLDSYFNQVRSKITVVSRPKNKQATEGVAVPKKVAKPRKWKKHYPYRPDLVQKWIDIWRVLHNFVIVSGKDKKTPAMRMGLMDRPATYRELVYFRNPHPPRKLKKVKSSKAPAVAPAGGVVAGTTSLPIDPQGNTA